jgi:hypothetical protein
MVDYYPGAKQVGSIDILLQNGRIRLKCDLTERWTQLDATSAACGEKAKLEITRRVGLSRTDSETLEGGLKAVIGLPGFGKFESEVRSRTGSEVHWEVAAESKKSFEFSAPTCGRRTNFVYQLVREYDLTFQDLRLFHRSSWSARVQEFLNCYHVRPNIVLDHKDCNCPKQPKKDDYQGTFDLDVGSVSAHGGFLSNSEGRFRRDLRSKAATIAASIDQEENPASSVVCLDLGEKGFLIEQAPLDREFKILLPRQAVPPLLLFLGEIESRLVPATVRFRGFDDLVELINQAQEAVETAATVRGAEI